MLDPKKMQRETECWAKGNSMDKKKNFLRVHKCYLSVLVE